MDGSLAEFLIFVKTTADVSSLKFGSYTLKIQFKIWKLWDKDARVKEQNIKTICWIYDLETFCVICRYNIC